MGGARAALDPAGALGRDCKRLAERSPPRFTPTTTTSTTAISPTVAGARKRRRRFPSVEAAVATYGAKRPLSALDQRCLDAYVRGGFR